MAILAGRQMGAGRHIRGLLALAVVGLTAGALPSPLSAQEGGGAQASPADALMQPLLEVMQQMQGCLSGLDAAAQERLQRRVEQSEQQIQTLCQAGRTAEAEARAQELAAELAADPAIQTMMACMARLPEMLGVEMEAPLGGLLQPSSPEPGEEVRPVCERLR